MQTIKREVQTYLCESKYIVQELVTKLREFNVFSLADCLTTDACFEKLEQMPWKTNLDKFILNEMA